MGLADVGKETVAILECGAYRAPSGREVSIKEAVERAVSGTALYRPDALVRMVSSRARGVVPSAGPRCEVTKETTADALGRLVCGEREGGAVGLNFASAKNPGGGFLGGARAQEEDLARRSALYACLVGQGEYYAANRAEHSPLYTDHIIYSPGVTFFRDRDYALMEAPYAAAIITAPAPNAGAFNRPRERVREVLEARAGMVLAVAAERGHRCLVLGAWGCGVFKNDPAVMAEVWERWVRDPVFAGAFDRVVFAIFARGARDGAVEAFEARFGRAGS